MSKRVNIKGMITKYVTGRLIPITHNYSNGITCVTHVLYRPDIYEQGGFSKQICADNKLYYSHG